MKRSYFCLWAVFCLSACGEGFFTSSYRVELPPVPAAWSSLLGSPAWRIEWIGPGGTRETAEIEGIQGPVIQVLQEWTTPILAYPFWTLPGVPPDLMKPAGGLFPFDVEGDRIRLSWQGGIEGTLYLALASQSGETNQGTPRYPHYFNWTRFRELMASDQISETLRQDPWSADWKGIAWKISQSGFDRRRIIPLPRKETPIPIDYEGFWISSSPFAEPVYQEPGTVLILRVGEKPDTYLSAAGILRCTQDVWVLTPCEPKSLGVSPPNPHRGVQTPRTPHYNMKLPQIPQ